MHCPLSDHATISISGGRSTWLLCRLYVFCWHNWLLLLSFLISFLFWSYCMLSEVLASKQCYSSFVTLFSFSLWSPYGIGRPYMFSCCGFFFLFFPCLISAAADWMSAILTHMVWPQCEFKMQVWSLLHAACWKHRTGYIFTTKARIGNRKKTC